MRAAALLALLLLAASPAAGQRVGVGYLNMGPVAPEPLRHVRSGNMGLDYVLRVEAGDRWTVGLSYSPTHLYVWPRGEEEVSRWSFRPSADARTYSFAWLSADVGRIVPVGRHLSVEPGVGVWVPSATDHQAWGAQMGLAPAATVELRAHRGPFAVACRGSAIRQSSRTWVVLTHWGGGPDATLRPFWSFPLSCALEVG